MDDRAIGDQLFISPRTVENHVRNILDKLRLSRRDGHEDKVPSSCATSMVDELMRWASEHGIE